MSATGAATSTYAIDVVDSVEEISGDQWNGVVERADLGSVYHRHEWLRAAERTFEREPNHLVAYKDSNLIGLFPAFVEEIDGTPWRRLKSIHQWYSGPLVTTDEAEVLERFVETIPDIGDDVVTHVIRTDDPGYVQYHHFLSEAGYEPSIEDCNVVVDLTVGWDRILSNMRSDRRRGIRKGNEQAFEIHDEPIIEETIVEFYDGYRSLLEQRDGDPLPRSFVSELMAMSDRLKLFSLEVEGTHVGAHLNVLDDERDSFISFLSAVQPAHYEYHPTELLDEHSMKWAIENGYERYDLGMAPADAEDGLFRYKMSLGGSVVPLIDWERGTCPVRWPLLETARTIHRRSDLLQRMVPASSG